MYVLLLIGIIKAIVGDSIVFHILFTTALRNILWRPKTYFKNMAAKV